MYHAHMGVQLHSYFNTVESKRPQHHRSAASVIAQQYSSATFVTLHFNSRNDSGCVPKSYYFNFVFFVNSISQKLRNFKLRQTVPVYYDRSYTNSYACSLDAGNSQSGTTGIHIEITKHH
jgi:hypothetical protein